MNNELLKLTDSLGAFINKLKEFAITIDLTKDLTI
jgi:hypothetical protein